MLKPLSAITESPSSRYSNNPHSAVSFLSEMLPPNRSELKHIAPEGDIAIMLYKVL